jgi:hypothetical protein
MPNANAANARYQRRWRDRRNKLARIAEALAAHDAELFALLQRKAERCATIKRQK